MLTIKDYLYLKEIYDYLEIKKQEMFSKNNGYTNKPIRKIEELMVKLDKILIKLESED